MEKEYSTQSGLTHAIWMDVLPGEQYPALAEDARADVCVVGAGIAGLSTAYLLAKGGRRVIVLDAGLVGGGETSRTSAHLASVSDDRFVELERLHGEDGATLAFESNDAAIHKIEQIAKAEKIDCDFQWLDAYLFCAEGTTPDFLDRELQAAQRAGIKGARRVESGGKGTAIGPAIKFPRQARFHPVKYLSGLLAAFTAMGGKVFENSMVDDVQGGDADKGERCQVRTSDGHIVRADAVVVCTNAPSPINDWLGIYLKQHSYRTYVVAMRIPSGEVADALFWDTADPYHYVRLAGAGDLLLVGGEDHKVGQQNDATAPFMRLATWARTHFPSVTDVVEQWSGQVQEPDDALPYIGRAPTAKPNVYCCTGDSGMGLTHGTIAGMLNTDLILGRPNPWETLYDPRRRTLKSGVEFARENANVAAQYADFVTPGDVKSVEDIPPGTGALLRKGLTKVAAYRDDEGTLHEHSAVCPHLGCVVHWNGIEKSWDCPCHGSRFASNGNVIIGPAVTGLKPIASEDA